MVEREAQGFANCSLWDVSIYLNCSSTATNISNFQS